MVHSDSLTIPTKGFSDILDITPQVTEALKKTGLKAGIACMSVIGSTASITTIEFEQALIQDFKDKLEEFWSEGRMSRHSHTWGDDNGFSHIRASMMGPSLSLPIRNATLVLGTRQQIVLVDHDNRPRDREVVMQFVGE